jgi:hypothetical protein
LFRNFKYDAIVACASIGAMIYYSGRSSVTPKA